MRVGVLTVSDRVSTGTYEDETGRLLRAEIGVVVERYDAIADERPLIASTLRDWSAALDVILTTGGTGLGPRDVTPDATADVIDRTVPGLAELMRHVGSSSTPMAALSRQIAGQRGTCLIINLPGSPKGALEVWSIVAPLLPHAVSVMQGDGH